ncbi:hypothetical protein EDD11_005398 [Mortierella claussenii]|nr:hypothetical protein EDD11_005398 [Mortierella claussenii]
MTIVLAISSVVLAAVDVLNLPASHTDLCPDAYLFELSSEPGGIGALQEVEAFKSKLTEMKSVHIRQEFNVLLNGISAQVKNPDELRDIMTWDSVQRVTPLTMVSPPEQVQPSRKGVVTSALNMTGATRVHAELRLKGEGIKVGIIDTGVDFTHPALGGCFGKGCKVAYGYDFVGDAYNGRNKPIPSDIPMDCAGHGSHVAGIVGALDDTVMGVAPQVTLGAYRVLGCDGSSNDDVTLAALERAVSDGMDVINLSIGEPNGWPNNPVARAIQNIKALGVMVTVSQGNENSQGLFSANYVGLGSAVMAVASIVNTGVLLSYFTTPLDPDHRVFYTKSDIPGLNATMRLLAPLNGTELATGCEPFQRDLTGKVVLVLRGSCLFSLKAQYAFDKGAAGILFANNVEEALIANVTPVNLPSGSISMTEGRRLLEHLKTNTIIGGDAMTAEVTISFSIKPEAFVNKAGGSLSLFSSYGLDNELHIKPDISAPGENIYSTWPVKNGSYATLSGTSMASPHLAGALALALQHFRAITGLSSRMTWPEIQRIYETFKNTAEPAYVFKNHTTFDALADTTASRPGIDDLQLGKPPHLSDGSASIDSVAKQGSGLVNIYRAVTSLGLGLHSKNRQDGGSKEAMPPIRSTLVTPASLELNDTEFAPGKAHLITIHNYGSETVQYELYHLPAEVLHELSIETKEVKMQNQAQYNVRPPADKHKDDVMFVRADAKVVFSTRTISVPARGQRRVSIRVLPPVSLSLQQHWIYSGYIVVQPKAAPGHDNVLVPSSEEAIHVPYAGVKGRMKTLPVFLWPTKEELQANNRTARCQVLGAGVTNKTDFVFSFVGKDIPMLSFCIANPTRLLTLDVISGGGKNDGSEGNVDDYEVIGRVASNEFVPRSLVSTIVSTVQWDGTLDLTEGGEHSGTKSVDGHELIHREPGMDLIYGMRAKSDDDLVSDVDYKGQLIQERADLERNSEQEQKEVADTSEDQSMDKKHDKKTASSQARVDRNQRLLAKSHIESNDGENQMFMVPDGQYRLRLRGLRMQGDIENPDDYDVWITRTFTIRRQSTTSNTPSTDATTTTMTPKEAAPHLS